MSILVYRFVKLLSYLWVHCIVLSTTYVLFLFMQSMYDIMHQSRCDEIVFSCAQLRIAIILPPHPVRDNEV